MTVEQTYATHRHRPRLTAAAFALAIAALVCFVYHWFSPRRDLVIAGLILLTLAVNVLVLVSRTYTTALQDRIILLEMKVRTRAALSPAQVEAFDALTKPQKIALRFASDAELPALIGRAAGESLTADQIKRAIKQWVPDYNRT